MPADVLHFDTPFVADIAHNADPSRQDTDHNPATPPVAPVPDADRTPSADFAAQPPGTYDDEMLDSHFTCGDGRCNENIALSAIHQVFHSEHDRLVAQIKDVLTHDTTGATKLSDWQLPDGAGAGPDSWNGERIFQAARFINEMEYQHAVFEEFGRKVAPGISEFAGYSPDVNPAISAEFAQAVYRFGHSMLDEDVARKTADPTTGTTKDDSVPLLTAFLNPPEYFAGGATGTLTPQQAAGSVLMGSSDQAGNEIDEFVTETLRNNLLGLPTDLAAINIARARESGIPPHERRARTDRGGDERLVDGTLRELDRVRPAAQAPGVSGQLRRCLRQAPDHPRCHHAGREARGCPGHRGSPAGRRATGRRRRLHARRWRLAPQPW